MIGDDICVVFTGGSANNIKIMVDAPKKYWIARGRLLEKQASDSSEAVTKKDFYTEPQHNMASANTNRQLGITSNNISKSSEKLSSSFRINRAGDDAAGLTISEKMRGQIRGLESFLECSGCHFFNSGSTVDVSTGKSVNTRCSFFIIVI